MARKGRAKRAARSREELPPPLPPETRTVGQLIAESVRFYRNNFWQSLPLGLPVAVLTQVSIQIGRGPRISQEEAIELLREEGATPQEAVRIATVMVNRGVRTAADPLVTGLTTAALGAFLLTMAFMLASTLVMNAKLDRYNATVASAAGVLVFVPVPFLASLFVLPAVAWLALVGLVVPVAIVERRGYTDSLRRAIALGRADYVHALGSLAALVIVYFVTRLALLVLLQTAGEAAERTAVFLADLVISPLLFLGGALLYQDQTARLSSRSPAERRRDADVPDAVDADRPGAAHAPVESRPAARGQPRR